MERRVPGRPPEIKILIKTEKNWKKSVKIFQKKIST